MSKGKKFNAAEKYFNEKELKLKKEIKTMDMKLEYLISEYNKLESEHINLKKENLELNTQIEKLLEYSKLDRNEIKKVCQKDIQLVSLLTNFSSFSKNFY